MDRSRKGRKGEGRRGLNFPFGRWPREEEEISSLNKSSFDREREWKKAANFSRCVLQQW